MASVSKMSAAAAKKAPAKKKTAGGKAKAAKAPEKETPKGKTKKKDLPPPKIVILDDYCKGCGICIAFCPTQVLAFRNGKASVENLEACIRCLMCEMRCPDFAITVED